MSTTGQFLEVFSQNNIPSFYFRFFQVHFPQNNDNLSIISTEIVVEEWKTHMWVSPPNRKPSGYLSSPHQNCLSLEIFTKTEKSWSELIVVSLFCWFSEEAFKSLRVRTWWKEDETGSNRWMKVDFESMSDWLNALTRPIRTSVCYLNIVHFYFNLNISRYFYQ